MTSFGYNMLGFGSGGGSVAGIFKAVGYVGDGTTSNAITGVGFQPDLTWMKNRDAASQNVLVDSVRGATKELFSNTEGAETTTAESLKTFDTGGFTVGSSVSVNESSINFISWNFKKDPDVFDIVSYVGNGVARTISHNMNVIPEMIIVKGRDTLGTPWTIYHKDANAGTTPEQFFLTFSTNPESSSSAVWNNTAPTSGVFSVGTAINTNINGENYITYLFASKAGVSKIGSWVGNGSTSGPTISLDFQPKFLLYKRASGAENWVVVDTTRGWLTGSNEAILFPNDTFAEQFADDFDVGVKQFTVITTDQRVNFSGDTYIYMAFA